MKQTTLLISLVPVLLLAAACGGDPTATPTPAAVADADGEMLFLTAGSPSCHGQDAEGTGAAPALAGHTEEQVLSVVWRLATGAPRAGGRLLVHATLPGALGWVADVQAHGADGIDAEFDGVAILQCA